jgi:hypothetical protein
MQIASFCRFLYIKLDPHIGSPSWLDVVAVGGLAKWGPETSIFARTMASGSLFLPHSFQDRFPFRDHYSAALSLYLRD